VELRRLGVETLMLSAAFDIIYTLYLVKKMDRKLDPANYLVDLREFYNIVLLTIIYFLNTRMLIMIPVAFGLLVIYWYFLFSNSKRLRAKLLQRQEVADDFKLSTQAIDKIAAMIPESKIVGSTIVDCNEKMMPNCMGVLYKKSEFGEYSAIGNVVRLRDSLLMCNHCVRSAETLYVPRKDGTSFVKIALYEGAIPLYKIYFEDVVVLRVPHHVWADTGLKKAKVAAPVPSMMATAYSACEKANSFGKLLVDRNCPSSLLYFGSTTAGFSGGVYMVGGSVVGMHLAGSNESVNYGIPLSLLDKFLKKLTPEGKNLENDTPAWLLSLYKAGKMSIGIQEDETGDPSYYVYDGRNYHFVDSDDFDEVANKAPEMNNYLDMVEDAYYENKDRFRYDNEGEEIRPRQKRSKRGKRTVVFESKDLAAVVDEDDDNTVIDSCVTDGCDHNHSYEERSRIALKRRLLSEQLKQQQAKAISLKRVTLIPEGKKELDALDVQTPQYRNGVEPGFLAPAFVDNSTTVKTVSLNDKRGLPTPLEVPRTPSDVAMQRTEALTIVRKQLLTMNEQREVLNNRIQMLTSTMPGITDPVAKDSYIQKYIMLQNEMTQLNARIADARVQEEASKKLTTEEATLRKTAKNRKTAERKKKSKLAKKQDIPESPVDSALGSSGDHTPTMEEDQLAANLAMLEIRMKQLHDLNNI